MRFSQKATSIAQKTKHLPDVGILVRGARQDVCAIRAEACFDEEGGRSMTSESSCGANVWPEGVVQVVHVVAHTHKQPGPCTSIHDQLERLLSISHHSFICSFIHPFVHSFVPSFIHSFICSFIHSSSFICSFIPSFIHSFVRSFVRSFIHALDSKV